ncbi:hypothetical protein AMJ49_03120 [Parcubacteria bacterium DG_74_2]|nr:MAG: hypothetical protein AMJ49_03120 [Parcubacteria bacterium DG_74_2]
MRVKFEKTIKKYTPNILKTIIIHLYVRWLYYFRYKNILAKNRKLKNKYKGKRCFLIGNGPSINKMDLTKLKNEYTFVFNFFYLHKDLKKVKPKFYFEIDSLGNLSNYGIDIDNHYHRINKAFQDVDVKMFYRIDSKEYIEKNNLFSNKDIYYLLPDRGILKTLIVSDDISKYHSFGDASIYCAICVAVYMGFSEIYLIGCDFDHIINKDEKHFYRNEEVGFKSDMKDVSNLILAENLYTYLKKMEKVKNHFKKYNVKIFNAGIGGFTDTFPRVEYNSLF